jgi:Stress responsive A/B Barrel Domain
MDNPLYNQLRVAAQPGQPYLHIVVFRPRPEVTTEALAERLAEFESLKTITPGIVSAGITKNLDDRKGWTHVEVVVFIDVEAFIAWHAHPAHKAFGTRMYDVAEWAVADANLMEAVSVSLFS